jgi:hypothetical protein
MSKNTETKAPGKLFPMPPSDVDFSDAAQVVQLIKRVTTASFDVDPQAETDQGKVLPGKNATKMGALDRD